MSIFRNLTVAFALTAPVLGTGCSKNGLSEEYKQALQAQNEREQIRKQKLEELTEIPFPLKNIRNVIPGIHQFDRNKNNVLEPDEITLLIRVLINDGKDEYTKEGKAKLEKMRDKIWDEGAVSYKLEHRGRIFDEDFCRPKNIRKTYSNFSEAIKAYESKLKEIEEKALDKVDQEIEGKIQRTEKKN